MGKGRGTLHTFSGFCYKLDMMLTTTTERVLAPAGQKLLAGERKTNSRCLVQRSVEELWMRKEIGKEAGYSRKDRDSKEPLEGGVGGESLPCGQERHPSQLSWWLFLVNTWVSPTSSPGPLTELQSSYRADRGSACEWLQATLGCRDLCFRG